MHKVVCETWTQTWNLCEDDDVNKNVKIHFDIKLTLQSNFVVVVDLCLFIHARHIIRDKICDSTQWTGGEMKYKIAEKSSRVNVNVMTMDG